MRRRPGTVPQCLGTRGWTHEAPGASRENGVQNGLVLMSSSSKNIKDVVKNKDLTDLTIKDIGLNMMTNLKRMCREIGPSPRIAQSKGEIDDYPLHFGNPLQQKGIFRSPTSRSFFFGGPQLLKIIAPVVAAESSVNMARGRPHQSTSCTAATRYQHAGSHRHCFQLRLTSLTTVCLQGAFSTN